MKHRYIITISYDAPQDVIGNGENPQRLYGHLEWMAVSREAARVWALNIQDCMDHVAVEWITQVGIR